MTQAETSATSVPLAVKLAATVFVAVLVPVYWQANGFLHFLWISDVALFATIATLWRESRLLNSMTVLLALPFESVWMVDFIWQLLSGTPFIGVTDYMFDPQEPLHMRGLSLFHIPVPLLWIWMLFRWGYDPRAFRPMIGFFPVLILATYGLTEPYKNINWAFTPEAQDWEWISQPLWIALYLLLVPLFWLWPMHALLKRLFPARDKG